MNVIVVFGLGGGARVILSTTAAPFGRTLVALSRFLFLAFV